MPTGVVIRDPREQLLAAAERVLVRDGPNALTSRSVTAEAGVAKGVLHRHFADFDELLVQLARARIARFEVRSDVLRTSVGSATVTDNVADALTDVFDPTTLGIIALVMTRDALRARLRIGAHQGFPVAAEATALIAGYLAAERDRGRLAPDADPNSLALTLIGTGHLLFVGELGGQPDADAIREVVESILVGVERSD